MNKFKKDDQVIVNSGKDKGKTGKILKNNPKKQSATIEGINIKSKHKKAQQDKPGGIIQKEYPISWSSLSLLEPKTKAGSKVEFSFKNKKKIRKYKLNKVEID